MKPYPDSLEAAPFYSLWLSLPQLGESVDPFILEQRTAVMRLLAERTNEQGTFGEDNALNIFWAYVLQLHWQWRSGRYTLAGQPPNVIDPNSIWGYNNYYLVMLPLVAAIQVGMIPPMEILPPSLPSRVEYISGGGRDAEFRIPPAFDRALDDWRTLMRLIEQTPRGGDLEPIRFQLWKAHGRTLISNRQGNDILLGNYAKTEGDFLVGWIRMVDFLQAAAWRTDFDFILETGMDGLPERILTDEDVPGQIPDFDKNANVTLKSIMDLVGQPEWRHNINLWMWRRAMRRREARDQVMAMLDATFHPSPQNAAERKKLLRYMLAW